MDIPAERNNAQTADSDILASLGKKQVLKRRFGLVSIFGFAICELITWETVLALFSQGLDNGGRKSYSPSNPRILLQKSSRAFQRDLLYDMLIS